MYDRLQKLYNEGKLSSDKLQTAVNYGWITLDEKEQIECGNQIAV